MRGKVASEKTLLIGTGITPAYAGKSLCLLRQKDDVWDHPRLCGEKMLWGRWNLYILLRLEISERKILRETLER